MKLRKKSTALLVAAMAVMMLTAGCGKVKVGYIEGSRVMKEAPQITAIVDEGNQKMAAAQKEAEDKMQQNPDMSQEDAQKLQQDTQRKLMGLNQSYSIQVKQKLDTALDGIAQSKKLDVVIDSEKEQPTAITGCVDVTDDVIAKLQ